MKSFIYFISISSLVTIEVSAQATIIDILKILPDSTQLLDAYNKKDYLAVAIKLIDIKFKLDPPPPNSLQERQLLAFRKFLNTSHRYYVVVKDQLDRIKDEKNEILEEILNQAISPDNLPSFLTDLFSSYNNNNSKVKHIYYDLDTFKPHMSDVLANISARIINDMGEVEMKLNNSKMVTQENFKNRTNAVKENSNTRKNIKDTDWKPTKDNRDHSIAEVNVFININAISKVEGNNGSVTHVQKRGEVEISFEIKQKRFLEIQTVAILIIVGIVIDLNTKII